MNKYRLHFSALSAILPMIFSCVVQAASFDCIKARTKVERTICDATELSKLDEDLDIAYRSENASVSNQDKLDQLNWLKKRNQCSSYDCLKSLYHSRIAELQLLHKVSPHKAIEGMDSGEIAQVCSALSHHIEAQSTTKLSTTQVSSRYFTNDEWNNRPETGNWPSYDDLEEIYELQLKPKASPTRFAKFWGKSDCRSALIINLDRFVASDGNDNGRIEHFDSGLDTEISLATAEDKLIAFGGRYFVLTSAAPSPHAIPSARAFEDRTYMSELEGTIALISVVRFDGNIQPICELKTKATSMKIRKGADNQICNSRAQGKLTLATWVQEDRQSDDCCPTRFSNPYRGEEPTSVKVTKMGLDKSGTPYFFVRLAYEKNFECGSVRAWATTLSENYREVAQTDLLDIVQPSYTGKAMWPDIYRFEDRTFVEVGRTRDNYELLEIKDGKLLKLCEFDRRLTTSVSRVFAPLRGESK